MNRIVINKQKWENEGFPTTLKFGEHDERKSRY